MKPLPPASNSANPLATAAGASSLTAQSNAQKLRTHAQHKPSGVASFMDQLTEKRSEPRSGREIGPPTADRPDTVNGRNESKRPGGSAEAEATSDRAGSRAATPAENPQTNGQSTPGSTGAADEQSTPSFDQEVVSVILEGVDPVLRLKPAAEARAARTVAGNTQAARNGIDAEPAAPAAPALEQAEQDAATNRSTTDSPLPSSHERADTDATTAQPVSRQQASGRAQESKLATPAQPPQNKDAQADATAKAAAASASTVQPPLRAGEQRVSLVPTLTAISGGAAGRAERAPNAIQSRESKAPAQVAEQVEHGLQVAMRDLPSPGGERLVTLRLYPSSLGSMRIAMHVSGETVNVRFQVGSAKAKAAVGKAIDDLRASITRQGLRVESMLIEEDSALAAPESPAGNPHTLPDVLAGDGPVGKEIAITPPAPHGQDSPRADNGTGRTPSVPEVDSEGGVLQVLTFRLDAVA